MAPVPDPLRLVRIVWEDISQIEDGPWVDREKLKKIEPMIFQTAAWLWELTEEHAIVTMCIGDTFISPRERIPTPAIKSITEFPQDFGQPVPIPRKRRRKP